MSDEHPITDALKNAIAASGMSIKALERDTGVARQSELSRLLIVARVRPLAEFGRETVSKLNASTEASQKCSRASWTYKPLTFDELPVAADHARQRLHDSPEFITQQERLGQERVLIYKLAVTTGLRKGDLASLTVGQLDLDNDCSHVRLNAADEKNRQGNSIPLRSDVADELREWVSNNRAGIQRNTLSIFNRGKCHTSSASKLFNVPKAFCKILNRDLKAAGIPKRDDRGRTIDVHALRHTFGTMLSMAGVSPRVAQAAMRHSSIDLTMNVYTDPRLLDVQGAVESLPEFSVTNEPNENRQRIAAGAENLTFSTVAVPVAVTVAVPTDFSGDSQSTAVTLPAFSQQADSEISLGHNSKSTNAKRSLPTSSSERLSSETGGTRTRNLRIDSPAL